jgi:hypothetical protein
MKAVVWQAVVTSSMQLLFLGGGGGCLQPSTGNSFRAGCRRRFLEARCAHGTWTISSISLLNLRTVQTAASRLGSAWAAAVSIQSSSLMSWVSPEEVLLASLKQVREVGGGEGTGTPRECQSRGVFSEMWAGELLFLFAASRHARRSWTHSGEGSLPCLKPAGWR